MNKEKRFYWLKRIDDLKGRISPVISEMNGYLLHIGSDEQYVLKLKKINDIVKEAKK